MRKGSLSLKNDEQAAEELQQALGLAHSLERMDCFDISHTQGSETVASMVVFRNGSISKKDYRKYKIALRICWFFRNSRKHWVYLFPMRNVISFST